MSHFVYLYNIYYYHLFIYLAIVCVMYCMSGIVTVIILIQVLLISLDDTMNCVASSPNSPGPSSVLYAQFLFMQNLCLNKFRVNKSHVCKLRGGRAWGQIEVGCQAMLFHYPLPLSLFIQLTAPQPFRIPTVKNVDLTQTTCQSVPHVGKATRL